MPFSDLSEKINDINFEHGFFKGLTIADMRKEFEAWEVEPDKMNSSEYKKLYDLLYNEAHKRHR